MMGVISFSFSWTTTTFSGASSGSFVGGGTGSGAAAEATSVLDRVSPSGWSSTAASLNSSATSKTMQLINSSNFDIEHCAEYQATEFHSGTLRINYCTQNNHFSHKYRINFTTIPNSFSIAQIKWIYTTGLTFTFLQFSMITDPIKHAEVDQTPDFMTKDRTHENFSPLPAKSANCSNFTWALSTKTTWPQPS